MIQQVYTYMYTICICTYMYTICICTLLVHIQLNCKRLVHLGNQNPGLSEKIVSSLNNSTPREKPRKVSVGIRNFKLGPRK